MKKLITFVIVIQTALAWSQNKEVVGTSPWGKDDEIGTLNMMTNQFRLAILSRLKSGKTYDLSVEYFVGCPVSTCWGRSSYRSANWNLKSYKDLRLKYKS